VRLKVFKDGYPPEFAIDVQWPNPNQVDYCGEKLSDRDCNEESKKPDSEKGFEVKICFTPMGKCPGEYKVDDGSAFGDHGSLKYGWGRDMTGNARNRASQPDELLRSFIMFPPDPTSLQCKKPNPDVVCDPVEWSIAVPRGKY